MLHVGRLTKRKHEESGKQEWALVSRTGPIGSAKVLKWFGMKKPTAEQIAKEEQRVQHFKNKAAKLEVARELVALAEKLAVSDKDMLDNLAEELRSELFDGAELLTQQQNLDLIREALAAAFDHGKQAASAYHGP